MEQNIPTRTNNPGDLKDPSTGQFRQFKSPEEGFQALKADLHGKMTGNTSTGLGPQSTLTDFAKVWAPASDKNDPINYAKTLSQHLKSAPNAPLASVNVDDLASAVAKAEGYQGNIPQRMNVTDFAQKIKQKYPAYQGLDDKTLTQKILAKYPQYQHSVDTGEISQTSTSPENPVIQGTTSIGEDLTKRLQQAGSAISQGAEGKINPLSAGLQTLGAGAGAVGDVATKALELVPGVKSVEQVIGSAIGGLANTPVGKSLVGLASKFAKEHPEISADIGAAANVASVIPMFKAVGLAASAGKGAVAKAFESGLAKATANEMESAITPTLRRTITSAGKKQGVHVAQDLIDNNALPEIVQNSVGKNVYSTATQDAKLSSAEALHENDLQTLLKSKSDAPISVKQARDTAIKEARDTMRYDPNLPKVEAQIHSIFDNWEERFGSKQTLSTLTDMKRDVRSGVKFDTPSHEKDASFYVGQGLMKSVEDTAKSRGIKGVKEINQVMQRLINARKLLAGLEGKVVKTPVKKGSWLKEVGTDIAGGVGETLLSSVPFAGTLAGRGLMSRLLQRAPESALQKLIRTRAPLPTAGQIGNKIGQTVIRREIGQAQPMPQQ